jgi:hypothetical protein
MVLDSRARPRGVAALRVSGVIEFMDPRGKLEECGEPVDGAGVSRRTRPKPAVGEDERRERARIERSYESMLAS